MEERVYEDPDKYRIEDEYKDPNEECECGEKKRVQDLYCNKCQKYIQDKFIEIIRKNFDRGEMKYLDEIFDGESIEKKVLGSEED